MSISNYQKTSEPSDQQSITTHHFISYLKSIGSSKGSIKSRERVLAIYFEWLSKEGIDLLEIGYTDLLSFMKWCNVRGVSQRTMQNYMGTVKHLYNYLINEALISKHPVTDIAIKGVKRKALYHVLNPEELHKLYHRYPAESYQDRRNKVILGMLVYQGLRAGELSKLTVASVQLREGKLDVLGSRKHNGRLLQLESYQVMDLYDYVLEVRPAFMQMKPKRKTQSRVATDLLFIGEAGNCYSFSNIMTQLMLKLRKLNEGIKNAEQLRASVITKWLRQHNLRETQYLAGHRYISSTESYLRNDVEGLKEAVQQFHPLG
jgi:integrase/recombinase XerD